MSKDMVSTFRKCVRLWSKTTGATTEEAVDLILPTVLRAIELELRQSVKPRDRRPLRDECYPMR